MGPYRYSGATRVYNLRLGFLLTCTLLLLELAAPMNGAAAARLDEIKIKLDDAQAMYSQRSELENAERNVRQDIEEAKRYERDELVRQLKPKHQEILTKIRHNDNSRLGILRTAVDLLSGYSSPDNRQEMQAAVREARRLVKALQHERKMIMSDPDLGPVRERRRRVRELGIDTLLDRARGRLSFLEGRLQEAPPAEAPHEIRVSLRADRTYVRANEEVVFRAQSQPPDGALQYLFEFGDGNRSGWTRAVARHNYPNPGNYNVFVMARLRGNTVRSNTVTIHVKKFEPPVARIVPENPSVTRGEPIAFRSVSTHDQELTISRYFWEGPGGRTAQTPSFTVKTQNLKPATYDVFLTVVDSEGQRSQKARTSFRVLEATPLVVRIDPPRVTVTQGKRVEFHSRSKSVGDIYKWTGPEGQEGTEATFQISTTDLEPGTYDVTLEVQDSRQRSAQARAEVIVTKRPEPIVSVTLSVNPNPAEEDDVVTFFAGAEASAVTDRAEYRFMANGAVIRDWSRDSRAEYVFRSRGTYTVMAVMRAGDSQRWESGPVTLTVKPRSPIKYYAVVGLLAVIGIYVVVWACRRWSRFEREKIEIQAIPRSDKGIQELEFTRSSGPQLDVRVRPVPDKGEQNIDMDSLLVKDRRE